VLAIRQKLIEDVIARLWLCKHFICDRQRSLVAVGGKLFLEVERSALDALLDIHELLVRATKIRLGRDALES
jgi:hypothetical protein